jgi:hypothetical protein
MTRYYRQKPICDFCHNIIRGDYKVRVQGEHKNHRTTEKQYHYDCWKKVEKVITKLEYKRLKESYLLE